MSPDFTIQQLLLLYYSGTFSSPSIGYMHLFLTYVTQYFIYYCFLMIIIILQDSKYHSVFIISGSTGIVWRRFHLLCLLRTIDCCFIFRRAMNRKVIKNTRSEQTRVGGARSTARKWRSQFRFLLIRTSYTL